VLRKKQRSFAVTPPTKLKSLFGSRQRHAMISGMIKRHSRLRDSVLAIVVVVQLGACTRLTGDNPELRQAHQDMLGNDAGIADVDAYTRDLGSDSHMRPRDSGSSDRGTPDGGSTDLGVDAAVADLAGKDYSADASPDVASSDLLRDLPLADQALDAPHDQAPPDAPSLPSQGSTNLLQNPGCESANHAGWQVAVGNGWVCGAERWDRSTRGHTKAAITSTRAVPVARRSKSLRRTWMSALLPATIDAGGQVFVAGGWISNWWGMNTNADRSQFRIDFFDSTQNLLDSHLSPELKPNCYDLFSYPASMCPEKWSYYEVKLTAPARTRTIRFALRALANGGSDNDGYFDEVVLRGEKRP
jgi:hypothetical protein